VSDTEPTGGKQDLRDEFLQLRRTLSPAQIETARTDVRAAVVQRCIDARWTTVAGYLPLRTEPGSHELLDELVEHGVRVLVPVMLPDRDLDWVALPGDVPLRPDAIASAQARPRWRFVRPGAGAGARRNPGGRAALRRRGGRAPAARPVGPSGQCLRHSVHRLGRYIATRLDVGIADQRPWLAVLE
jgi:5-formyltetrahydrofolate cyclo-ligase